MKRLFVILLSMVLSVSVAYADGQGNVGVSYSQIIDDRSLGVTGDYSTPIGERVTFEADAQIQSGDIHNIKVNTNFIFDVSAVDLKLLIQNKAKGYTLGTLGREQSLGLAFSVPLGSINVDVGIGGKNASPFAPTNAHDTLVGEGFAESALADRGLEVLTPAPKGLPFKNGSALNAFVTTGFKQGIFDIDIKGIVELLGEGDKQHQFNTTFKTSGNIADLAVTTALELGLMSYQETIHYETAVVTTVGFDF